MGDRRSGGWRRMKRIGVGGQVGRKRKKVHETGSGLAELGTNGITHRHTRGTSSGRRPSEDRKARKSKTERITRGEGKSRDWDHMKLTLRTRFINGVPLGLPTNEVFPNRVPGRRTNGWTRLKGCSPTSLIHFSRSLRSTPVANVRVHADEQVFIQRRTPMGPRCGRFRIRLGSRLHGRSRRCRCLDKAGATRPFDIPRMKFQASDAIML